eukprot:m.191233 g.191233  ORF g.191233 m.191233 type:complete len:341 (-) comp32422_c0_seq3:843-1865(-)
MESVLTLARSRVSIALGFFLVTINCGEVASKKLVLSDKVLESYGDTPHACNFFVSPEGDDNEEGAELEYPLRTIACATDPNCNNGLEASSVVCVHASTIEVYEPIRIKAAFQITLLALGDGVTLDAFGQTQILNSGRTPIKITGFTFTNAFGSSGAAVYGEAKLEFIGCNFHDNEASGDAAAVMVSREGHFSDCTFTNNKAKWGGAVRISDIGWGSFTRCWFMNNQAISKGGAIVTQIETPSKHSVKIKDTTFCLNASPTGKHIYNFRDQGHQCTNCSFNTRECCSSHGRVTALDADESAVAQEGDDVILTRQHCSCDDGWEGLNCEINSSVVGDVHTEF